MTHEQLQAECATWYWNEFRFTEWARMLYQNKNNSESRIGGARDKALGTRRGISDMTFIFFGEVHFIEFKVGADIQRPEQIEFQNEAERRGHKYFIIKSFEQFKLHIWRSIGK